MKTLTIALLTAPIGAPVATAQTNGGSGGTAPSAVSDATLDAEDRGVATWLPSVRSQSVSS